MPPEHKYYRCAKPLPEEADFPSHYALKWSPNDAEVKKVREEIAAHIEAWKGSRTDPNRNNP